MGYIMLDAKRAHTPGMQEYAEIVMHSNLDSPIQFPDMILKSFAYSANHSPVPVRLMIL